MNYTIDRFEGAFAICEDEAGVMQEIERALLPPDAAEGDLLRNEDGKFVIDAQATARRRAQIRKKLESLWEEE